MKHQWKKQARCALLGHKFKHVPKVIDGRTKNYEARCSCCGKMTVVEFK